MEVLARHKSLHLALQKEQLDLPSANLLVRATIEYCESEIESASEKRTGGVGWQTVWHKFTVLIDTLDLPPPQRRVIRRVKRDSAAQNATVLDTEEDYRTQLFLPILQATMQELKRRFEGGNHLAFQGIECMSPMSPNFLKMDQGLSDFALHYSIEVEAVRHDILTYWTLVKNKAECDSEFLQPTCLTDLLNLTTSYRMAMPHLHQLAQIEVTIPVGTASCERSFSTMRRIKTWLRCQTADERLNWLAILCVHRRRAKALSSNDYQRVVTEFKARSSRKMLL